LLTPEAETFVSAKTFEALARKEMPRDLYPHLVEADLLVIAPLTANTLGKLANGLADSVLTAPGRVVGTLDYLAPEVIRGEPAGPASDIYALGCLLYECVCGSPPFGSRPFAEAAAAHLPEEPAHPLNTRDHLPPAPSASREPPEAA